ncbi:Lactoylglutathione lyase [Coemansia erecta]|uniref:Aldoketomutase n=1 Tax=Coemansia erecta TaxID=147472 RepID=A0A9W7XQN8_9FUNG|nr:Lactoylglutathione lyase [Coemansia erecta]
MTTDISTYRLNHTMYRIKDSKASLKFYTEVIGMQLLEEHHFAEAGFSVYFLGFNDPALKDIPRMARQGIIELMHTHGTEDKELFAYNTGNGETGGYGHVAITVDRLQAACDRFESLGVQFVKRPEDGPIKSIAFIADPDGYHIEVSENPMLK